MANGTVGVRQATSPDRLIDNEVLTVDGETVYRQRVQDPEVLAALATILVELGQKLEAGQEVALSSATLAALETVTTAISNFPSDYPDAAAHAKLDALLVELQQKLEPGGSVGLASTTLDALAAIAQNTQVDNFPADYPDATVAAALGTILTELQQKLEPGDEVALSAATLAALESITAKIQVGGVDVGEVNRLPVDVGDTINIDNVTVEFDSIVSTLNIPPAPLGANEVFTGGWEDVKDFASIAIAVFTDQNSAYEGATVQFSADGSVVLREQGATLIGGLKSYFEIAPEARYFRIVYTNGPVAQTFLYASIIFRFNPPGLIHAPLATPSDDLDIAGGTKAHLVGRDAASAVMGIAPWVPVQVDSSGHLYVRATDLDIRNLALAQDSVRQTQRPMSSYVNTLTASTTITAATAGANAIRLLRIDGGSKPDNTADTYVTVTIALGANTVFAKTLQVGEPFGSQVCIEGAPGEDLGVALSGSGSVEFNLRYETI